MFVLALVCGLQTVLIITGEVTLAYCKYLYLLCTPSVIGKVIIVCRLTLIEPMTICSFNNYVCTFYGTFSYIVC